MTRRRPGWTRSAVVHGAIVAVLAVGSVGWNTVADAPPRFDGAGYAVLAESLRTGHGYREIDHPDAPRHAHFPPGYPILLASLWRITGPSPRAAHLFSITASTSAILLAWVWFRRLDRPGLALGLGIALAVNWSWGRIGGSIQSEPLFLLLEMAAIVATGWALRGGSSRGVPLGLLLGACVLTRHVGVCLALAVGLDLLWRRRFGLALTALLSASALVSPWIAWLAIVRQPTQVGLLPRAGFVSLIASQALFYLRRLPDQITGPVVEVGTVFRPALRGPATAWAAIASGLVVWGWLRSLRTPRRRLAGLVPLTTLPLLLVWPFTEAGRFLIPLVPFVLVGAFEGLSAAGARIGLRSARPWAVGAILLVSIPYAAYAIATDRAGALDRSQAAFDAACAWIAEQTDHPGPVLTRQPGEVFWQTGRTALPPPGDDPEAIDRLIARYGVAYLLVDEARYVHAPESPLGRYVEQRPGRVERVWSEGPITVFAVVRHGIKASGPPSKVSVPSSS